MRKGVLQLCRFSRPSRVKPKAITFGLRNLDLKVNPCVRRGTSFCERWGKDEREEERRGEVETAGSRS